MTGAAGAAEGASFQVMLGTGSVGTVNAGVCGPAGAGTDGTGTVGTVRVGTGNVGTVKGTVGVTATLVVVDGLGTETDGTATVGIEVVVVTGAPVVVLGTGAVDVAGEVAGTATVGIGAPHFAVTGQLSCAPAVVAKVTDANATSADAANIRLIMWITPVCGGPALTPAETDGVEGVSMTTTVAARTPGSRDQDNTPLCSATGRLDQLWDQRRGSGSGRSNRALSISEPTPAVL